METQRLIWCKSSHSSSKHIALPSRWNWFVLLHEKAKRKQTPKEMGETSVVHINLLELLYFSGGTQAVWRSHLWEFFAYRCIELTFIPVSNDERVETPPNPHSEFRLLVQKKTYNNLHGQQRVTGNEQMKNLHTWANTCSPATIPCTAKCMWSEVVPLVLGLHYSSSQNISKIFQKFKNAKLRFVTLFPLNCVTFCKLRKSSRKVCWLVVSVKNGCYMFSSRLLKKVS